MSMIETDSQNYTAIADAIRTMNGSQDTYYPNEMATAIRAIPQETYDVFAPIIYSLDEREVGVWKDGKPLYQKTIFLSSSITLNQYSWTDIYDASSLNIENLIDIKPYAYGKVNPFGLYLTELNSSNHIRIMCVQNWVISGFTIQYTKTTDTAGSGQWTPSGVPAVHYDGTEKIIGTWFGETLYQKTVHINSLPSTPDTGTTYPHNISNINNVIDYQAVARWPSGEISHLNHLAVPNTTAASRSNISVTVNKTNITFTTGLDRSSMSADVTIQYTKTT